MPWFLGNSSSVLGATGSFPGGLMLLMAWSLVWKGIALWHAARRNQTAWFVVILVLNTVGILEIVYLAFVAKIFAVEKPEKTAKRKR